MLNNTSRVFLSILKWKGAQAVPSSLGMVPVRLLECRNSFFKSRRLLIDLGILPERRLPFSPRNCLTSHHSIEIHYFNNILIQNNNFPSLWNHSSLLPPPTVRPTELTVRSFRFPISSGIGPDNSFSNKWSSCREDKDPMVLGMPPVWTRREQQYTMMYETNVTVDS